MPENVLKPIFFKAPIIQEKENTTLEVIFAETVGKTCRTTNEEASPQKNKPCVFPWIDRWTKKIHEGCAAPDGDEHGLWCPTKLNDDMEYVDGKGDWGYCTKQCLIKGIDTTIKHKQGNRMGTYEIGNGLVNGKRYYDQVSGKYFNRFNPNAIWYVDSYEGKNYSNWIIGYKTNIAKGIGGIMSVPVFRIGTDVWPNSAQKPPASRPQDVEKWYWAEDENSFCCKSSDYVTVIGKSVSLY